MDDFTAHKVIRLTSEFYASSAESFSATRAHAWKGWQCVFDIARNECTFPLNVLDIACGNMRFERFLADNSATNYDTPNKDACIHEVLAIDNCKPLVEYGYTKNNFPFPVIFKEENILELLKGDTGRFDSDFRSNFTVAFGFMHHIPKPQWRHRLLQLAVESTQIGGLVAVSFWQFAKDEHLKNKAHIATQQAALKYDLHFSDANDYLLGWQDSQNIFRYCHNYEEEEIDELVCGIESEAVEIARFSADGKNNDLNRYVVLKVRS